MYFALTKQENRFLDMKLKLLFFIISFIFLGVSIEAQKKKNDSIILKDIDYYRATNLHIDSLLLMSKKMQKSLDPCIKLKGYSVESNMYYKIGDYKEAEVLALQILDSLKTPKTPCERITKFNLLGRLFWVKKNTNRYDEALKYSRLKRKLSKDLPNEGVKYHIRELSNASNIALIKDILGFNDEAIEILQSAMDNFDESKFTLTRKEKYAITLQKSSSYNILGDAYLNKGTSSITDQNLDSAFVYYKKAYTEAKKFDPPHKNSKPFYNLNRVKVLIKQNCYQKALDLLNTFTLKEKNFTIKDYTFYKSIVHYNLHNTDSTLYFSDLYINDHKITPSTKKNRIFIYDILSKEYHNIHKADSSYKYSELVLKGINELDSSILKTGKSHYLYDFEKIKEENNSSINKTNDKQVKLYLLFSTIVLTLGFFIYSIRKRRKKLETKFVNIDAKESSIKTKKQDYNIDEKLEKRILKELSELEKSTLFLDANFSIIDLAKKMETNTSYLSFIINKNKNTTFKHYLLELRINYLTHKLATEKKYRKYTIQSLGEEIGYTNASAFTRAFKKQMRCTPSIYIKSLKKN